ncbi:MAG: hypothetical protein JXA22_00810 [Candidatus Thermoplasmatota archaeon]|nr:hypothetical protein [Candidatus Thermoplasmatota archaeon]
MAGLYPILGRYMTRLKFDRRYQLKWSIAFFFILSLLFSLGDGILFSFGWFALGLMGVLLSYRLLERYFFLAIWLGLEYIMIFWGSMLAFRFAESWGNWFIQIFGYTILVAAFIGCLFLILFIKDRRDLIALEGEYAPIGLWSTLVIFGFYMPSIFSMAGFIRWADGAIGNPTVYLVLYLCAELIVITSFILITSFPEDRFRVPYLDSLPDEGFLKNFIRNLTFREFKEYMNSKSETADVICPQCGETLHKEMRKCPTCDAPRYFYWCDTSEDFFVRCPNCQNLTPIGSQRCIHCDVRMSNRIRCSKCKDVHTIIEWV